MRNSQKTIKNIFDLSRLFVFSVKFVSGHVHCLFPLFFSVCFCVSSAFSVVRSEPGSVRTFRKSLSFYCLHLCGCGKGTCVHSRAAHSFWHTVSGTQFGVSPFLEIRVGSFLGPPVVIFFKSCIIAVDVFSRMCPVRSFDPVVSL